MKKVIFKTGASDSKESACIVGDPGLIPGSGRFPWRRECYPLQYSCLGKSHGQKSLVGYSPWGCKELDMSEWTNTHLLKLKTILFP